MLYRFNGVRARTSPGRVNEMKADFSASDVADAWREIVDLLPCDGEWDCQLFQLGGRVPRRLKSKTLIRVTPDELSVPE